MAIITAREFNHDVSAAKRSATTEPLIITDRGEPAYVLLTYADFERMTGRQKNIVDILRQDDPESDFDVEFPRAALAARDVEL
ncbi:type II toxin-antitoxin system Phd/YefM family antitoxin [Leifsonia sp. NPDC077715]|uniref:type II toxin-antitoxin system Phd/YefM family antitoxin n=1 Tax=Leifsonia sp. NPDC077715 TaxID=3155539 RepID=UPI0034353326